MDLLIETKISLKLVNLQGECAIIQEKWAGLVQA